jgi:hypothetical protein
MSSISWNVRPFKADIFGNSQKSFESKLGEQLMLLRLIVLEVSSDISSAPGLMVYRRDSVFWN